MAHKKIYKKFKDYNKLKSYFLTISLNN